MKITHDEFELILDYCFGRTETAEPDKISSLITSKPFAARLYESIDQAKAYLDLISKHDCPDELVDLTVARLKLAAFKNTET